MTDPSQVMARDKKTQGLTMVPLTGLNLDDPFAPRLRTYDEHANALLSSLAKHQAQVRKQIVADGAQQTHPAFHPPPHTPQEVKANQAYFKRAMRAHSPSGGGAKPSKPGSPMPIFSSMDVSNSTPEIKTVVETMARLEAYDAHAKLVRKKYVNARDRKLPLSEALKPLRMHAQSTEAPPPVRPTSPTLARRHSQPAVGPPFVFQAGSSRPEDLRGMRGGSRQEDSRGSRQDDSRGSRQAVGSAGLSRRQSMGYGVSDRMEGVESTAPERTKPVVDAATPNAAPDSRTTTGGPSPQMGAPVAKMVVGNDIDASRDPRQRRH